jgi:hypothetical protein
MAYVCSWRNMYILGTELFETDDPVFDTCRFCIRAAWRPLVRTKGIGSHLATRSSWCSLPQPPEFISFEAKKRVRDKALHHRVLLRGAPCPEQGRCFEISSYLESLGLAAGTINQRHATARRLAYEAEDSGLLSPELAAPKSVRTAARPGRRERSHDSLTADLHTPLLRSSGPCPKHLRPTSQPKRPDGCVGPAADDPSLVPDPGGRQGRVGRDAGMKDKIVFISSRRLLVTQKKELVKWGSIQATANRL